MSREKRSCVLAMSEMDRGTRLEKTWLFKNGESTSCFAVFLRRRRGSTGRREALRRRLPHAGKCESKGIECLLAAETKREKDRGNDGAMILGLNNVSVALLASLVPVANQAVTVWTELASFF